jgi:sugar lactone lactonase YvrE
MKKCEKCGQPLPPDALLCDKCGAVVGVGISQPDFMAPIRDVSLPDFDLPQLDFTRPGAGLGEFTMPREPLPGLLGLDLGEMKFDFTAGRLARGREYRAVLAIGRTAEGESRLGLPFSLFELPDGHLYVIDFIDTSGRARVQLFDPAGNLVRVICTFEVGAGREALDTPVGIVADVHGNFYIPDMGACCIKKYTPDGEVLAMYGQEGVAENELNAPQDVDLDDEGNLYIADTDNNRILKWSPEGRCLLVLGINQPEENDPDWLMAGEKPGEFDGPKGVTVDAAGNILVVDTNNHRIQKFSLTGECLFVFGEEGEDAGEFSYPNDIQVDNEGNIYVSDLDGGRIQKFDADGHFVYQIILPSDAGSAGDFEVGREGHLLVALRKNQVVLKLEVA